MAVLCKDTACGRAGMPSQLLTLIVRLSPDLADCTEVGTENMVRVAKLFLKNSYTSLIYFTYISVQT